MTELTIEALILKTLKVFGPVPKRVITNSVYNDSRTEYIKIHQYLDRLQADGKVTVDNGYYKLVKE